MDINKIENTWNEFSKSKNIDLKFKERKQGNVVQSHYLINYADALAAFSFIGILWKSDDGKNTDKTSIIIEFENKLDINNFEFKTADIESLEEISEFEKSIIEDLQKFNGNSIALKDNFIRIDTNHLFSTINEFHLVTNFVAMLKQ